MKSNLGEIFYNGKIVDLRKLKESGVEKILSDLKNKQTVSKENITGCLEKMKNI